MHEMMKNNNAKMQIY